MMRYGFVGFVLDVAARFFIFMSHLNAVVGSAGVGTALVGSAGIGWDGDVVVTY